MTSRVAAICGCLAALLLCGGSQVWARSVASYKREARKYYLKGKTLAQRGKNKEALTFYKQALSLLHQADSSANAAEKAQLRTSRATFFYIIGRTYHFDKQHLKAIEYYRKCLGSTPKPRVEQKARSYLALLLTKIQATLVIHTVPPGARIAVSDSRGGGRFGKTPFVTQIEPGRLQIRIEMEGYQTHSEWLELKPGIRLKRVFQLKKKLAALPPPRVIRQPPRRLIRRPPPRRPAPRGPAPWLRTAAYVGFVVAGVALVAGIVFTGVSVSDYNAAQEIKGDPSKTTQELQDKINSGDAMQALGITSFIVAGLGAGAGVALFLLSQPKKNKPN